jgi:lambda family phage portal protein
MGQVFEAGEVLVRLHQRAFGNSAVPLGLELIEAERLADNYNVAPGPGNRIRMGVEVDEFDRPVAYWLRNGHPGDLHGTRADTERLTRVPAEQILHLYVVDRWPQTRGEPWLHAAARKLNDLDGYSEAEIIAARNSACYMGFITAPDDTNPTIVDQTNADTGEMISEMEPGLIRKLAPGETFESYTPTRPNAALDPFMRAMLREVAAAIGVSYESLSRDYGQTNYSSGRMGMLDDRDLWKTLQQWWIRSFRAPLHKLWLRQAVLSRAITAIGVEEYVIDPVKWEAVRWKPRGWSWVDPTKEVQAYKEAVLAGFTTVGDVIAQTSSNDLEDVLKARSQELKLMAELGLQFDTDPELLKQPEPAAAPSEPDPESEPESDPETESDPEAEPARVYAYPTR